MCPNGGQRRQEIGRRKRDTVPNDKGIGHAEGQGNDSGNGHDILGAQANTNGTPNKAQRNYHTKRHLDKVLGKRRHEQQQEGRNHDGKASTDTSQVEHVVVVDRHLAITFWMRRNCFFRVQVAQIHQKEQVKDKEQQKDQITTLWRLRHALNVFHEQLRRMLSHMTAPRTFRTVRPLLCQKDGFSTTARVGFRHGRGRGPGHDAGVTRIRVVDAVDGREDG